MLQRLLSLGPSQFPLVAEAIEHLGNISRKQPPFAVLIPCACIEQTDAEKCVANGVTVSAICHHLTLLFESLTFNSQFRSVSSILQSIWMHRLRRGHPPRALFHSLGCGLPRFHLPST
jgi:hypothetical protein